MTWRGTTTVPDRLFGALPYLLPLIDVIVMGFATPLFRQFPILQWVVVPLTPFLQVYSLPFASLILFFALFLLVVRNDRISHFIRFNTMQAIMIDIVLFLCKILDDYILGPVFQGLGEGMGFGLEVLYNMIFLGVVAVFVYGVVQSLLGKYAEVPTLSDAVYMQLPR
jgi:hypothetical protein